MEIILDRPNGFITEAMARRLSLASEFAVALLLMILMLYVQSHIAGPITHADEGSYLLGAAGLAGDLTQTPVAGYHFGYSVLLIPAYLLSSTAAGFYSLALATNALLAVGLFFISSRILYLLLPAGTGTVDRLLLALVVCTQVSFLPYTMQSLSDNALTTLYALAILALIKYDRTRSIGWLIIASAALGYLYPINPRGLVCAIPLLGLTAWQCAIRDWPKWAILLPFGAVLFGWVINSLLDALAGKSAAADAYSGAMIVAHALNIELWPRIILITVGTLLTGMASALLLPVAAITDAIRSNDRFQTFDRRVFVALVMGFLLLAALTGVFFAESAGTRSDYLVYQRYVATPLCALTLLSLPALYKINDLHRRVMLSIVLAFAIFYLFLSIFLADELRLPFNKLNAPLLGALLPPGGGLNASFVGLLVSSLLLLTVLIVKPILRRSLAPLLVIFIAVDVLFVVRYIAPQANHSDSLRTSIKYLNSLDSLLSGRVCLELGTLDAWSKIDHNFYLMNMLPYSTGKAPCQFMFYLSDADDSNTTAKIEIMPVNGNGVSIYTDAATYQQLAPKGVVLPKSFRKGMPLALENANVRIANASESGSEAAPRELVLAVENQSPYVWPVFPGDRSRSFRVGVIYQHADGSRDESRVDFDRPIFPGEMTELTVTLDPRRVQDGTKICMGVLQEHVAWAGADTGGTVCLSE